ncbi:hypothetical protein T484DRAFT_1907546, partial [Baffinella frigidus]
MRGHASSPRHPRIHRKALLLVALATLLSPVSPSEEAKPPGPRVEINFPRDGHVFWSPPQVDYSIDGLETLPEGQGWWAHVEINNEKVAEMWDPEGTIVLNAVWFMRGVEHHVSIHLFAGTHVEAAALPVASRTVRFTAEASDDAPRLSCVTSPENCVSADDLALEPLLAARTLEPLHPPSSPRGAAEGAEGGDSAADSETPVRGEGWGQSAALGREMLGALVDVAGLPKRRRGVTRLHASSNAWTERLPDFGHFLRAENGELVMMDSFGPGCIFRMFFPVFEGPEQSGPKWRLRLRIDGLLQVDMTMEELTDLATPPFVHPLAGFGDVQLGFLSLVPLVFHQRCTVSFLPPAPLEAERILRDLVACLDHDLFCSTKVYWDIDYVRFASRPSSPPFSMALTPRTGPLPGGGEEGGGGREKAGGEVRGEVRGGGGEGGGGGKAFRARGTPSASADLLATLRLLYPSRGGLAAGGKTPPGHKVTRRNETWNVPAGGAGVEVWAREGEGCVYELRLREVGGGAGGDGGGKMEGAPQIDVAVSALFLFARSARRKSARQGAPQGEDGGGGGGGGWGDQAQSLLLGHASDGTGYLYFPMPFFRSARITVFLVPRAGLPSLQIASEVAWSSSPPPGCTSALECGLLHAQHAPLSPVTPKVDYPMLTFEGGWGHVVAVLLEIEAKPGREGNGFYEGDLKVWIDGASTPRVHETGTEDFFNSAHGYAALANFSQALFGAPFIKMPLWPKGYIWHIYRLLLGDAISFQHSIVASLEHGSVQNNKNLHTSNLAEGDYGSLVLFYAGQPSREDRDGDGFEDAPLPGQLLDTLNVTDAGSRAQHVYREEPLPHVLPAPVKFDGGGGKPGSAPDPAGREEGGAAGGGGAGQ